MGDLGLVQIFPSEISTNIIRYLGARFLWKPRSLQIKLIALGLIPWWEMVTQSWSIFSCTIPPFNDVDFMYLKRHYCHFFRALRVGSVRPSLLSWCGLPHCIVLCCWVPSSCKSSTLHLLSSRPMPSRVGR